MEEDVGSSLSSDSSTSGERCLWVSGDEESDVSEESDSDSDEKSVSLSLSPSPPPLFTPPPTSVASLVSTATPALKHLPMSSLSSRCNFSHLFLSSRLSSDRRRAQFFLFCAASRLRARSRRRASGWGVRRIRGPSEGEGVGREEEGKERSEGRLERIVSCG